MIDKIMRGLQDVTEAFREQTTNIGEGAKARTEKLIEDWLQVFPKLEIYGLEITSFALGVALSPSIEVELVGKHELFTKERIKEIIDANRKNTILLSVFNTINTAYSFHRKTYATLREPLIVKIKVKLSPEIQVFIGEPMIQ
ncbi:MAG: hypothetical protein DHS20C18_44230 [Saprospiraceae bacterium]|nr:MAG: hypothetical protein DHS20C18_44230 [Saprospiraceae bacterium]